jgi:hypothetical protein
MGIRGVGSNELGDETSSRLPDAIAPQSKKSTRIRTDAASHPGSSRQPARAEVFHDDPHDPIPAALNTNGEPMPNSSANQATPDNPNPKGPMPPDDEPIPDTMRMITYEDAARASLRASILELGLDEVLVLDRLAERLRRGQRQYGFLHLANDRRAFRAKEAREELEDALVYLACAWLKAETREVA